jgi:hypothetical protein
MELNGDQCSAIAQIIPVLMLATVLEQRAMTSRMRYYRGVAMTLMVSVVITGLGGIFVAVSGIDGGLTEAGGLSLALLVFALSLQLLVSTFAALSVERARSAS